MTDETELTQAELERQDDVDNAIYDMVYELGLKADGENWNLDWDIEWISEIRDIVWGVIVERENRMTSHEFYPYHELETEEDEGFVEPPVWTINDENLMKAIHGALDGMDADDLAYHAGELIGGDCWARQGKYYFTPNENYMDAFGPINDEEEDDYNVGE